MFYVKGIYENYENLQLYINNIKNRLKTTKDIKLYVGQNLKYNDKFIVGLIYQLKDVKKIKFISVVRKSKRQKTKRTYKISNI